MENVNIGVIGGSGLYQMAGLMNVEEVEIDTPFGKPSDTITVGTLYDQKIAFVPRHGRGHFLTPSDVPYNANIYALKTLGVKYLLSISACGSLKEEFAPGHIVIPDQIVDFTKGKRINSFFRKGLVAHVGVADPFSAELSNAMAKYVAEAGGTVHKGATFITIEGPRFSTRGESNLFRQWGMGIIGMTASPEAYLAREAEMAYACMAHVTDYDVWHESEDPVTVEMVIKILQQNTTVAQEAIRLMVQAYDSWASEMTAHTALKDALITDPAKIPPQLLEDLNPIVGKYYA
ncbi:MAG: S-methyl-5'-thioadenosine phosphorylase [Chloroflexota bacterium]